MGRVRAPDRPGQAGLPLLLALQLQHSLPLAQGLTFTTAPLLPPGKGQDPGGPAVLSEPLLQQPPPSPSVLGITGQRSCLSPPGLDWPLQRLRQLLVHLIVKNLQLRFKKSSHKMTSQNQSVPTLCCPPTTTSYQEGLDSPAVTAGLWDSRGSGSSHTPWMGKLRTPYPQLREMGQEPAWPRFPLHHSSGHHSSPSTKKTS